MLRTMQAVDKCSLRQAVRRHIQWMGDSADEVAGTLASHGVRGRPGSATDCAIARYLHVVLGSEGSVERVLVKSLTVRVYRTGAVLPVIVGLPKAVSLFIRGFDEEAYPFLVERPQVALEVA